LLALSKQRSSDPESQQPDELDQPPPLSYAAEHGHEAIVQLLLAKNAEAYSKDSLGRTPLS